MAAVVHVRPVHDGDAEAIRAMHGRMSSRSLYLRYFSAVDEISETQLRVYTDVDHVRRVCLVAVSAALIVGAGSYHADPHHPDRAEVAFAVQDDQQGRGLGSILLEHLAAAAQERGIARFTAEVLSENRPMMRVFWTPGTRSPANTHPESSIWGSTSVRRWPPGGHSPRVSNTPRPGRSPGCWPPDPSL